MSKLLLSSLTVAVLVSFSAQAQTAPAQPNDFIEVFAKLFGEHKGIRKGHAKGVCAVGDFTPSAAATAMPIMKADMLSEIAMGTTPGAICAMWLATAIE